MSANLTPEVFKEQVEALLNVCDLWWVDRGRVMYDKRKGELTISGVVQQTSAEYILACAAWLVWFFWTHESPQLSCEAFTLYTSDPSYYTGSTVSAEGQAISAKINIVDPAEGEFNDFDLPENVAGFSYTVKLNKAMLAVGGAKLLLAACITNGLLRALVGASPVLVDVPILGPRSFSCVASVDAAGLPQRWLLNYMTQTDLAQIEAVIQGFPATLKQLNANRWHLDVNLHACVTQRPNELEALIAQRVAEKVEADQYGALSPDDSGSLL